MYAYLKGIITVLEPTRLVLEVNNIGFELHVSLNTSTTYKVNEEVKIFTYLHVKEDAQILFGFANEAEKALYLLLISISGVGPNTALTVLSSLKVAEVKTAIVNGDTKTIQSVKGIGAKTAQRIILELKDKLQKETLLSGVEIEEVNANGETENILSSNNSNIKEEALSALMVLGIARNSAEKGIDLILKKSKEELSIEDLVRAVLKQR